MSDHQIPTTTTSTTGHREWCDPSRCLVVTVEPSSIPVVLEHVAEPVELATTEGTFTLERVAEGGPDALEFIRFTVRPEGAERAVIHVSASDAKDLAEALRSLADQIGSEW